MGLRARLRKLQEKSGYQRMTLVCPECGEEFTAHGDVAIEYIVHEWSQETGEKGHHETPEDILRLFDHEHDVSAFVEKTSGLPFLSKEVSGLGLGHQPSRVEDLSE
jgi:hypothetical protein